MNAQAAFAAEAPTGSARYDMVGDILAAAWAAPEHAPRSGPVHAAISFLREIVGLDPAPVGVFGPSPLCDCCHQAMCGCFALRAPKAMCDGHPTCALRACCRPSCCSPHCIPSGVFPQARVLTTLSSASPRALRNIHAARESGWQFNVAAARAMQETRASIPCRTCWQCSRRRRQAAANMICSTGCARAP